MTTLNINGRRVRVDDSFLSLSPEQQQQAVEEIAGQLGVQSQVEASPRVDPITNQPAGVPAYSPPGVEGYDVHTGEVGGDMQPEGRGVFRRVDDFVRGAADMLTLGFADEIAAGAGALTGVGGEQGDYDANLAEQRQRDAEGGWERTAGQVAGGIGGGVGLARQGLSAAANAANAGRGLGRVAAGSALDGAVLGAAHGAGSGEGAEDRARSAAIGSAIGSAGGVIAPYAIAGAQAAGRAVTAPVMARIRPEGYAARAVGEGMRRAGMTADDVSGTLQRAVDDGQDMFMVADAMGHSGQRMLSTVARNPNEMRQPVVDALQGRQMGQGDRLSHALAEGFAAPDTAAQRAASLTAARTAAADVSYEAARKGAGAVDVSDALTYIDDVILPGVNKVAAPGAGMAPDSMTSVMRRAKGLLTDGKSVATNFDRVLRAKQEISDMIGTAQRNGKGNQVRLLSQINNRLDAALERASPAYRAANDTFRQQSRAIDAVDTGKAAASGRTRATDNIQTFQSMTPDEQAAFRAGYVDPMIARVEGAAVAPSTNKARPLMTGKTGEEFPAFAAPGKADQLGRRVAREQRMFETSNAALGGSKTADNLADASDMAKFDPGIMANLFSNRPIRAAVDAAVKLANEARGMPPQVMEQIARTLIETRPNVAKDLLEFSATHATKDAGRRALINAIAVNLGASTAGRLGTP